MANLKQITRGISKLRGGLVNKSGKKLKVSDYEVAANTGKNQLIIRATVRSENPAKSAAAGKAQILIQNAKIKQEQLRLKDKKLSANQKKTIRLKIAQRKKNIATLQRSKDNSGTAAKQYKTTLIFGKMDFQPEKGGKFTQSAKAGGKLVWFEPTRPTTEIKMRCTCPDFRHNFAWSLASLKSLAVSVPQKYFRLTPASNGDLANPKTYVRPPRPKNPNQFGVDFVNPQNHMGFCKHLFMLLQQVKTSKDFKER